MKIRSFPNAMAIVVIFILAAGVLTYIIPKGKHTRVLDAGTNREIVVPGSYTRVDAADLTPFEILVCIPRGIIQGGEVVVLILLVGGCLFIVEKSGALKEGVASLTQRVKGKERLALVMIGFLFALGGATEGLQEEIIPLIPVLLVFTKNLGYSPVITVATSYGAASIGSTFSPVNPFGVVIAQKLAEVPFLSAGVFRLAVFGIAFALWMAMIIRYATKNRVAKEDGDLPVSRLSRIHALILVLTLLAFVLLIYGMLSWEWGFNEISAEFFVLGITVGLSGGLGMNGTFRAYAEGLKEMTFAATIVGMTYGISLVLREGAIIDSIIYGLFMPLQHVVPVVSAFGMMLSQALLHIALPSYSGQAVLTIPILAPLSDLIGLSRNVCVMAYQYGAILMDLVIPTNGALMAIISIAGIPYQDWIGFVFKRLLIMFVLCALSLFAAVMLGV